LLEELPGIDDSEKYFRFSVTLNMGTRNNNADTETGDRMLAQYLLGQLSEEEQNHLEERLFTDECYEQLIAVEEDLVEAYLLGELSPYDRERFESHFLASPSRRSRVEFTKTLYQALNEGPSLERIAPARNDSTVWWLALVAALRLASPAWRFSLAAGGLALLIGVGWLLIETPRLRSQSQQLRAELDQSRQQLQHQLAEQRAVNDRLMAELQSTQDQVANIQPPPSRERILPSSTLAFVLTLNNSSRSGGEGRRLVIPRHADQIQLQLIFPPSESYRSFIASLQTPEGEQIASPRAKLIAPGKVILTLATDLLMTNDYILTLKGLTPDEKVEEISDYQFTVVKK
jgi:hypothetical protein